MPTFYILGNGFDIQHKLPTDYENDLRPIAIKYERFSGEWDAYNDSPVLWSELEYQLAYPEMDGLIEHLEAYAPDMLSKREADREGVITEAECLVDFPLEEFAEQADAVLSDREPLLKFAHRFTADDFFLTFNYTHTLEPLYDIDPARVLHIHGEVGKSTLLMGYEPEALRALPELRAWDDEESYDYYRSAAYAAVAQRIKSLAKHL